MSVLIVIPAFNEESSIMQAIQSVLECEHQDIRVAVIDNASTDTTAQLVEEYARRDNRVSLLCNSSNIGMLRNFSKAFDVLAASHAEFVGFLPANDQYLPGMVDVCLEAMAIEPQSMVFSCNVQVGSAASEPFFGAPIFLPALLDMHLRANYAYIGGTIFRRGALSRLHGFNMTYRYLFDAELLARAKLVFPSIYVPQVLACRDPGGLNQVRATESLRAPIELGLIRLNLWDEFADTVLRSTVDQTLGGVARYCLALSSEIPGGTLFSRYRHLALAFANTRNLEVVQTRLPHDLPLGSRLLRIRRLASS